MKSPVFFIPVPRCGTAHPFWCQQMLPHFNSRRIQSLSDVAAIGPMEYNAHFGIDWENL